jgi:hypothetical protein
MLICIRECSGKVWCVDFTKCEHLPIIIVISQRESKTDALCWPRPHFTQGSVVGAGLTKEGRLNFMALLCQSQLRNFSERGSLK